MNTARDLSCLGLGLARLAFCVRSTSAISTWPRAVANSQARIDSAPRNRCSVTQGIRVHGRVQTAISVRRDRSLVAPHKNVSHRQRLFSRCCGSLSGISRAPFVSCPS